jgi:Fe-S-cluster containining protein
VYLQIKNATPCRACLPTVQVQVSKGTFHVPCRANPVKNSFKFLNVLRAGQARFRTAAATVILSSVRPQQQAYNDRVIDEWFASIRQKYSKQMQCGRGCAACCHGLFDISLSDAAGVAAGLQHLPPPVREEVSSRAVPIHGLIRTFLPADMRQGADPALFHEDDPQIDRLVHAAGSPPCPLLGKAGECLIYEHRPLPCRLEGVPMVDSRDGLFADWCELNFTDGVSEAANADLTQDYDSIDSNDERQSQAVARRLGLPARRTVTFIASVVAEFESYWKRAL